jgi:hypothetical protein
MRLPLLGALAMATLTACAPPPAPAAELIPPERPCAGVVEYPTDTVVDFRGRRQQLGPRLVSGGWPRYPVDMRNRSVEGSVRAAFVVDTAGRVPPGTAVITAESDRAFGDAVCTWLAGAARFEPLVVGGRRYAVRMENYPVDFTLTP